MSQKRPNTVPYLDQLAHFICSYGSQNPQSGCTSWHQRGTHPSQFLTCALVPGIKSVHAPPILIPDHWVPPVLKLPVLLHFWPQRVPANTAGCRDVKESYSDYPITFPDISSSSPNPDPVSSSEGSCGIQ